MPLSPKTFEPYLSSVNADKVKKMARMWGGVGKLRKDECLALILAGLQDPAKVHTAVESLDLWEQNALAILKTLGGETQSETLKAALYASGVPIPRAESASWRRAQNLIEDLFERGLLLSGGYSPGYFSGYGNDVVYSDHRLLKAAGLPLTQPFLLKTIPTPPHTLTRRPPTVALDVIGMLQAIANLDGLGLTKAGKVRDTDLRKLRKAMKWSEEGTRIDDFLFPDPAIAWINAFRYSDILQYTSDQTALSLAEAPETFAARSYAAQIRMLLEGFLRSAEWVENYPTTRGYNTTSYLLGRLVLVYALQSLPLDEDGFFAFDAFEQALFTRVGEHFSLSHIPNRPYFYRDTPKEQQQQLAAWQDKIRAGWLNQEVPWLAAALTTWAYFLGLVELAMKDDEHLLGLRLTPLGREVLHPERIAPHEKRTPRVAPTTSPAWIIQPNFDVIVYIDQVSPLQLAFIERFANRDQAQTHTAHYRITRPSVYRGLESGATLVELLDGLQNGARAELPQNVRVELAEWAALREQISLFRRARVVEFPDATSLQAALRTGWTGTVIGERFLRLSEATPSTQVNGLTRVDYAAPLPPCLTVSETGEIHLKRDYHDLWIRAQLAKWAETNPKSWQLTAASVRAAVRRGRRLADFLNFLQARLRGTLPPFLRVALRAWAGEPLPVELGTGLLLRCANDEIFEALTTSVQLHPFLNGKLAPNVLLVEARAFEQVKAILAWAGLEVSEQFEVKPVKQPGASLRW
jgi:hypothetical protein